MGLLIDRLTVARVLSWRPCDRYQEDDAALLRRLVPEAGLTPLEVADCAEVSIDDRFWVLLREEILPAHELRLLACGWAEGALMRERAAGREPDARSWAAVEAARQFARGEATKGGLAAAAVAALAVIDVDYWAAGGVSVGAAAAAAAGASSQNAAEAARLAQSWGALSSDRLVVRVGQLADVRAALVEEGGR